MSEDHPDSSRSVSAIPLEPFGLSPKETALVENCGIATVYNRLNAGEYDALREGAAQL